MASAFHSTTANSADACKDPIIADEEKIKEQKKNVMQLLKQLKSYSESYRKYLSARKTFFATLENLYEDDWEAKWEFSRSVKELEKAGEQGAHNFDGDPVQIAVHFREEFNGHLKAIKDYKEKAKQLQDAKKKASSYMKKKNQHEEEVRRLKSIEDEKHYSLSFSQKKLREDLPKFYNSRMEFYSKLWKRIFENYSQVSSTESDEFSNLLACVRQFDQKRMEGAYDAIDFNVREDEYALEDGSDLGSQAGDKANLSRASSENSCYAIVHKQPASPMATVERSDSVGETAAAAAAAAVAAAQTRPRPPVPHKPSIISHVSTLQHGD